MGALESQGGEQLQKAGRGVDPHGTHLALLRGTGEVQLLLSHRGEEWGPILRCSCNKQTVVGSPEFPQAGALRGVGVMLEMWRGAVRYLVSVFLKSL